LPTETQSRLIVAATAIVLCLAYLAGGARGIAISERDRVFSPADAAETQLRLPARDVPIGNPPTLSNLTGRGSLAVALGRRTALRDAAAVIAALTAAVFGLWLRVLGLPIAIVVMAMLGMGAGATLWGRGIAWSFDALVPLLIVLAAWAAQRWRRTGRRLFAVAAIGSALAAVVEIAVNLAPSPATSSLPRALIAEFTPLGVLLIAIGVVASIARDAGRRAVLLAATAAIVWELAGPRSTFDPITLPLTFAGWTAVAAGLAWLQRVLPARTGRITAAAVAAVIVAAPMLTRIRLWDLDRDLASEQRTRAAAAVRIADLPQPVAFVAESHRADALVRLSAALARRDLRFVPQSVDQINSAVAEGVTVMAAGNARSHLAQRGMLFEGEADDAAALAVVAGHVPCVALADSIWQDVSLLLAHGSLIVHGASADAAPGGVVIRMASAAPLAVTGIEPRSTQFEIGEVATDAEGVARLMQIASRGGAPAAIASLRIPKTDRADPIMVKFSTPPAYAVATAEDPVAVSICAGVAPSAATLPRAAGAAAALRMDDNTPFGSGWHPVEADPDFFRWTAAPDASVRLSLARPGRIRVTITATPASRPAQKPTIALTVNSCRLDVRAMQPGQGDYEWDVDGGCWQPGVNQLWLHTSPLISPASLFATHDTRLLGSRIGAIRLTRLP
jgi:hypothetical protein